MTDDNLEPLWRWWCRVAWMLGWRLAVAVLALISLAQVRHGFLGGQP